MANFEVMRRSSVQDEDFSLSARTANVVYEGPLDSRTRFSHTATVSARKPASFWREIRDTVVILVRVFAKMSSCQKKLTTR